MTRPECRPATIALLLLLALQGCAGDLSLASPTATASQAISPSPTALSVAEQAAPDTLVVGLQEEPDTLYTPLSTVAAQRMVDYAIREPWITSRGYAYQANQRFLDGELPTLENGGALLEPVVAFLDAGGAITSTRTQVTTTTVRLSVTFRLRPGLRWSDGQPLTARDVLFGHARSCQAEAVSHDFCRQVERLELVDELTWRVIYLPGVRNAAYSIGYGNAVLPEHQLAGVSPQLLPFEPRVSDYPLGWGPFLLAEHDWQRGAGLLLRRNPYYAGLSEGLPRMARVLFKLAWTTPAAWQSLYAGELDLVQFNSLEVDLLSTLESAVQNGKVRAVLLPSADWEHLDFNLNDQQALDQPSLLADPLLRQAIALGANREAYARALYAQQPPPVMRSFIPPASWAYAGDDALLPYGYDPVEAQRLLNEAGYQRGEDGIRTRRGRRLSLRLVTTEHVARERLAQLFQSDMAELGIEVELETRTAPVLFGGEEGLLRRKFDLALFGWEGAAEPSLASLYTCAMIPRLENHWWGQNWMGWCNQRASDALLAAEVALSREERRSLYALAQVEFNQDLPSLPLFALFDIYAMAPQLEHVEPDPTEYVTWNIAEWSLPIGTR